MKKTPQKERNKPFFCHDQNLEFLRLRKECSQSARFVSLAKAMGRTDAKDSQIIAYCQQRNYHVITHNTSDFRSVGKKIHIGIICVGLKDDKIFASKFAKMLRLLPKHQNYYDKTILIENNILVVNRKTREKTIL